MKPALKAELIELLQTALASAQAAHAAAMMGATHEEARAENDKDTRGLEQSYLARGQAQRVAELEAAIVETTVLALRTFSADDPIAMSALITVEEAGAPQQYMIAPHGGGSVLAGGVQVVTPGSPLGRALLGKRPGDEVELRLPGRVREMTVRAVA